MLMYDILLSTIISEIQEANDNKKIMSYFK